MTDEQIKETTELAARQTNQRLEILADQEKKRDEFENWAVDRRKETDNIHDKEIAELAAKFGVDIQELYDAVSASFEPPTKVSTPIVPGVTPGAVVDLTPTNIPGAIVHKPEVLPPRRAKPPTSTPIPRPLDERGAGPQLPPKKVTPELPPGTTPVPRPLKDRR